jgi:hypothetical protein
MTKSPKFLIIENKMADFNGVYILHTRKPRFLTKVKGDDTFEFIDIIDDFSEYKSEKINGILKRLTEWYAAYKIYKDGNR